MPRAGRTRRCYSIIAAVGTTFTESCLVAAPGAFTVNFDNQAAGITHNFEVLDKAGGKLIKGTKGAAGPSKQTLDLDLKAGDYYFQCVVPPDHDVRHPCGGGRRQVAPGYRRGPR